MHDHDDLDFAMLTPPTRPGPCKAVTAPEVDPVEKRLEQEHDANFFRQTRTTWIKNMNVYTATIAGHKVEIIKGKREFKIFVDDQYRDETSGDVRHVQRQAETIARSGKVKV